MPKPLYYKQAPGFEVTGANGEKLVCRALTAHQGRIDSARLFSTKFGRDCAKLAGMRRYLWDPQLWGFHRGPLAATSDDLEKVLASVAEQPGPRMHRMVGRCLGATSMMALASHRLLSSRSSL